METALELLTLLFYLFWFALPGIVAHRRGRNGLRWAGAGFLLFVCIFVLQLWTAGEAYDTHRLAEVAGQAGPEPRVSYLPSFLPPLVLAGIAAILPRGQWCPRPPESGAQSR